MEATLYAKTREAVVEHLQENSAQFLGLQQNFQDSQNKIDFSLQMPGGLERRTEVKVDVQKQIVMVYSSVVGLQITGKETIKRLVRFMARANESLYFGNLEYNFETAETRYKTSQIFQGITEPKQSIRFLLQQHVDNFPRLAVALKSLSENPALDPVELGAQASAPPS